MKPPKQNLNYLLASKIVRRFLPILSGPSMMLQVISEYKITQDNNLEKWKMIGAVYELAFVVVYLANK